MLILSWGSEYLLAQTMQFFPPAVFTRWRARGVKSRAWCYFRLTLLNYGARSYNHERLVLNSSGEITAMCVLIPGDFSYNFFFFCKLLIYQLSNWFSILIFRASRLQLYGSVNLKHDNLPHINAWGELIFTISDSPINCQWLWYFYMTCLISKTTNYKNIIVLER